MWQGLASAADVDAAAVALELVDDALGSTKSDYWFKVAEVEGQLGGYICYGPTPMTEGTFDLYWIVVDPGNHRRRIGMQLMDATEAVIRDHGGAMIIVETSSRDDYGPTRAFYEALLYDQAAHIADYYAAGDDLIVFTKRFPSHSRTVDHV